MGNRFSELTEDEKLTVMSVFGALQKLKYKELNSFLGSSTIERMCALENKLYKEYHYGPYCERHGIKLEDMTEDDYANAYEEENYISEVEYFEMIEKI